ncbi:MAG: DUF2147 domain-containing protein [Cyclobacteriaceae bacterium]|jgi:uncharacterized protein (DUF2147 family)|nr:DUF2147 domain-containing protein [Cyclobacteriaceae bacterium]
MIDRFVCFVALLFIGSAIYAQASVHGRWKSVDDKTGEAKSIVEIFERNGKTYGRIVSLLITEKDDPDPVCKQCAKDDARYNQKILGMEIIRDLRKSGKEYVEGTILDPEVGKVYRCKIWLEADELKVRGYLGPLWRTQTWKKA